MSSERTKRRRAQQHAEYLELICTESTEYDDDGSDISCSLMSELEKLEVCISVYLLFIFQLKKEISLYTNDVFGVGCLFSD